MGVKLNCVLNDYIYSRSRYRYLNIDITTFDLIQENIVLNTINGSILINHEHKYKFYVHDFMILDCVSNKLLGFAYPNIIDISNDSIDYDINCDICLCISYFIDDNIVKKTNWRLEGF